MNDALYSVLQRITTPTLARGYQLPQTGDTTPHRKQLPHQGANAANGEELPQDWRVPADSKWGGNPSFNTPTRRQTANQGTNAASGGNLPQGWRQQSNQGKTAHPTPHRKQLPHRQETGQIHSTAFSCGNLRKRKLTLRKSLRYPHTGSGYPNAGECQSIQRQNPILTNPRKESPTILNGIPDNKPPRRGIVELTGHIRTLPMLPGDD